jgi:hypothetical protein
VIHKPIITNINISIPVEILTIRAEVFLPYTSPMISVTKKRIGTKNIPTDALTDPRVVILLPSVFTRIIEVMYRANKTINLLSFFSTALSLSYKEIN